MHWRFVFWLILPSFHMLSCSVQVASTTRIEQHRHGAFPSSSKVLLDSIWLEILLCSKFEQWMRVALTNIGNIREREHLKEKGEDLCLDTVSLRCFQAFGEKCQACCWKLGLSEERQGLEIGILESLICRTRWNHVSGYEKRIPHRSHSLKSKQRSTVHTVWKVIQGGMMWKTREEFWVWPS